MKACIPQISYSPTPILGTYSFNGSRRLKWLQRLCFWVLDKIGCEYYDPCMTVKMVEIDFDRIVDLIMQQEHAVRCISNRRCKYVLLGHKQMCQLNMAVNDQTQFAFPLHYYPRVKKPYKMFMGLKVILVPWFDGVLCLEELE